ncbi:DNA N-6-adenine-methyltransferase [Burkholderia gladioli]|uniref:DNA N-6-adenine-methyltransferase n=1 Tax=Burkholderia gladioli TaxID=28095 RepID=UPI003D36C3BB
MSLSAHQSARMKNDEWLTPPEWIRALGPFELDPCAPVVRPWDTARIHFTIEDNGLEREWLGRVWCNPPFGRAAVKWLRRMSRHGNGIALIPARTETTMFYETVWPCADSVCFVRGRPHFHYVDGTRAPFNSGAPICLVAYSRADTIALLDSRLGHVVET